MNPQTSTALLTRSQPELLGQTVVIIGGSAGIGRETARKARSEGADIVLTGRDPDRLQRAALDLDARGTAAFDAGDPAALHRFLVFRFTKFWEKVIVRIEEEWLLDYQGNVGGFWQGQA